MDDKNTITKGLCCRSLTVSQACLCNFYIKFTFKIGCFLPCPFLHLLNRTVQYSIHCCCSLVQMAVQYIIVRHLMITCCSFSVCSSAVRQKWFLNFPQNHHCAEGSQQEFHRLSLCSKIQCHARRQGRGEKQVDI